MSDSLKVLITNRQKDIKIPSGIRLLIRRCCHAVLRSESFDENAEISVSFVNNGQIRQLNAEFRNKDIPTDVLSFPLGENGVYDRNPETGMLQLGDIVISVEKAVEQAHIYGHSLQREIGFLTVHSMLHLLGYDHEAGGLEQVRMREKEEAILASLGLQRDASYVFPSDET
ncbi:MAG: rRNA maturation RNase YbeY [Oscillospiraceae bacterium]|nr:rRNA maturation RNase YbeY [Oscillospiraceae bacterium]MCI9363095.1 rRNA maturation RNase YbeY [Oscillospiraceae bacterium]MCI9669539.1 rRNA maturation RNase YbeY [Oscillospiraceae bacterium]RKJ58255.1 rRNA maturation RNase YbeY [bacterium 1XD42-8]RKJ66913.1 rRNA maturation RNase YbeY [bacterium 1XD42-1]